MKLGIMLNHLGPTQLAYSAIFQMNKALENYSKLEPFIFYENMYPQCLFPTFPVLHSTEMFNFDGTVIATDLSSAEKLINAFSPKRRLFYVWDLEWHRPPTKEYRNLERVYRSSKLELIPRSYHHSQAIEHAWNVNPLPPLDNFNYEELLEILKG